MADRTPAGDADTTGSGVVFLVGAGPGDPGLITVKGRGYLETADVVIYDRLVDPRILALASPDAEVIDVGKLPGESGRGQADINALLVKKAREAGRVVRLKGGDPLVFGRGGEEAGVLVDAGISFELVPGVSSAIAAPAYAGIPLTHRGYSSSFTVVTGTEAPDKAESSIAWDALAAAGGTLIVLMGSESLPSITEALVRYGRPADTPVALVQWGTKPNQRTVVGQLSNIAARARDAGMTAPVVTVIGEVVGLRERLRWFDRRPLFGKRVLVTRTRSQAGTLSASLTSKGAEAIELPSIDIQPLLDNAALDDAVGRLSEFDWVVFTSADAVSIVFERLASMSRDTRAFAGTRVAAIGTATAAGLRERGLVADYVPERFVSEALVEGLAEIGVAGASILLPRSSIGREIVARGLSDLGAKVHEVAAYTNVTPDSSRSLLTEALAEGIDVATFTSSSTVTGLGSLLDGDFGLLGDAAIACIGPVTAQTARDLGLKVDILAKDHTIAGLVAAIEEHFSQGN